MPSMTPSAVSIRVLAEYSTCGPSHARRGVASPILATSHTKITRITRFSLLLEDERGRTLVGIWECCP